MVNVADLLGTLLACAGLATSAAVLILAEGIHRILVRFRILNVVHIDLVLLARSLSGGNCKLFAGSAKIGHLLLGTHGDLETNRDDIKSLFVVFGPHLENVMFGKLLWARTKSTRQNRKTTRKKLKLSPEIWMTPSLTNWKRWSHSNAHEFDMLKSIQHS